MVRKHEGRKEKINWAEQYPDGYSIEWRDHEMKDWKKLDPDAYQHYIDKYKEHEANRTSTNDRNKYWQDWAKRNKI